MSGRRKGRRQRDGERDNETLMDRQLVRHLVVEQGKKINRTQT